MLPLTRNCFVYNLSRIHTFARNSSFISFSSISPVWFLASSSKENTEKLLHLEFSSASVSFTVKSFSVSCNVQFIMDSFLYNFCSLHSGNNPCLIGINRLVLYRMVPCFNKMNLQQFLKAKIFFGWLHKEWIMLLPVCKYHLFHL